MWFQLGMAAMQGVSGAMKGSAERSAGQVARQSAYANAAAMDREAGELDGESMENQMRMRAMQGAAVGSAVARTGASGVERSGSALQSEASVATRYEQEVNDLAGRSLQRSAALRQKGQMTRWEGRQAERAAKSRGFGSLLGGVMGAASTAYSAFE